DSPFDLLAYTDSDYARASLNRKSTTRGCQFLRCRLISWKCIKQTVVANSTTEVEDSNEKKLIQMIKIHTDNNVAGLLTKAFDDSPFDLVAYTISDYAGASLDKKSTTGGCQFLGFRLISLQYKKQTVVANSITEAEYVAASKTIADKAVNEEMYDSLERATTTVTSLDVEQDWGNIKTTKTAQAKEIANLKKKVKRLERKRKLRSHGLKRLYKIRLSARVKSSTDEESLDKEDASKQGRISDIDANQDIYLVNVHIDEDIFGVKDSDDTSMFDADKDLQGEEVVVRKEVAGKDVSAVEEINAASIAISDSDDTLMFDADKDLQGKEVVVRKEVAGKDVSAVEEINAASIAISVHDKGKGIMVEPEMPLKKKAQISLDKKLAFKLQAEEDEQERTVREKAQQIEEVNLAWDDIQAKVDADYELAESLQAEEQEQLTDAEKVKLFMEFMKKRRKFFAANRAEEKRNKPPTKAQQRSLIVTNRVLRHVRRS
nr:putative ribonuclease H-like domain-containing protein [Tanacetum cinerariifolium]